MLTLTITDPHLMSEEERLAVLAFAKIRVQKVLDLASIKQDKPIGIDAPDVGIVIPLATQATFAPPPAPPAPPAMPQPPVMDAATVFGEAAAASSVPIPLPPAVAPAVAPGPASAPGAPAAAPSAGVIDLDARGLPWDHRIHASTKNKNADGGWKKKKNVDPATISQVEGELKALLGVPKPPPVGDAMKDGEPTTFPELMQWVSKLVAGGKLTQAHVVAIVQPIGLSSVVGLGNRPDLIPDVYARLKAKAVELGATA